MSKWPGTWRIICDVCGFEFASDEVKLRWDNLITCEKDWETKHPQLLVRVREESGAVPYSRPEAADQFIYICTLYASQGLADSGEADCARADIDLNLPGY